VGGLTGARYGHAVAEFLSDAWLADLARAASTATAPSGATLVVQLVVEDEAGTEPTVYAMAMDRGEVTVTPGGVDGADVTLTQDRPTALAIAQGELSAQVAFMSGRLRIGGDLRGVLEHAGALAAIADIFAEVRDRTTW
jgi:putative sterol carrier protein